MLKFFGYFTDGAILQRGEEIRVEGYADRPAECVLSACGKQVRRTVSRGVDGTFFAVFPPVFDTEHDYTLSLIGGKETASVRVRFGDVYLAMGQSNMSYALGSVEGGDKWRERAKRAQVAFLNLYEKPCADAEEVTRPVAPLRDFLLPYAWIDGGQKEIESVSAISVQTAAILSERQHVPVGVVHTAMGGLSVEAYIPRERLETDAETLEFTRRTGRYQSVEEYNRAGGRNYSQLSGVWNEKIAPLIGRKFKGFIWYLGESSAWDMEFANFFLREMKMVVEALRFSFGALPFVAVQIAPEYYPYGDRFGYEYINEALVRLQDEEPDVHTIPIYDIEPRWFKPNGERYFHPIHPVNKSPISRRVAEVFTGKRKYYPRISEVAFDGARAVCTVEHCKQLTCKGEIFGFTLCGGNGKYYPAAAKIVGENRIEVASPDVARAAGLTYAFMQYQDFCRLTDRDGAPLLPYRSKVESVDGRYYFPPAFTKNGALKVYENNFGIQVGNCRKVPVWTDGKIYGAGKCKISSNGEELILRAKPTAKTFFLFGVSPEVCLCGHKNHLADFEYLRLELRAEGEAEFLGAVARRADGELFRFDLTNGTKCADALPVSSNYRTYTVRLSQGMRGDGAPVAFTKEERQFVQLEFSFRASEAVTVRLKNVTFSDVQPTDGEAAEILTEQAPSRADIRLPETTGGK